MNGASALPRTGSTAMPCDFTRTSEGSKVRESNGYAVPNMRSRWFDFGADITFEFESVHHCIDQAYLSVHNCHRNTDGNVIVSFTADTSLGTCRCVAEGHQWAEGVPAVSEAMSNIYTGSCSPEEMPYLYLPTILNCAPRPPWRPLLRPCPVLVP